MAEEKETLQGCVAQMLNENARFVATAKKIGPVYSPMPAPYEVDMTFEGRTGTSIYFHGKSTGKADVSVHDAGRRFQFAMTPEGVISEDTLASLPNTRARDTAQGLVKSFNTCLR